MAKKNYRGLSKKGIEDLFRITNKENKRVWLFKGNEYETLREVVEIDNKQKFAKALAEAEKNKKEKIIT